MWIKKLGSGSCQSNSKALVSIHLVYREARIVSIEKLNGNTRQHTAMTLQQHCNITWQHYTVSCSCKAMPSPISYQTSPTSYQQSPTCNQERAPRCIKRASHCTKSASQCVKRAPRSVNKAPRAIKTASYSINTAPHLIKKSRACYTIAYRITASVANLSSLCCKDSHNQSNFPTETK